MRRVGFMAKPFAPARKVPCGLVCVTVCELEATAERIERGRDELSWVERDTFASMRATVSGIASR